MGEIAADTRYGPGQLPSDAILVARWDEGPPARWVIVGVATGYANLEECRGDAHTQVPGLDGQWLMVTKVAGNARKDGRVVVKPGKPTVTIDEQPPV